MPKIVRYEPQPTRLKTSSGLERALWSTKSHLEGVDTFDEVDLAQYDRDTIFYDIFLNYRNDRLIAIGPPLVNLEYSLLPLEVYVSSSGRHDKVPVKYTLSPFHNTLVYEFNIPFLKPVVDPLVVEIRFADGTSADILVEPAQYERSFLTVTTLQKDNAIEWIRDWVEYHYRQGADRFIIYDNGSENADALLQSVNDLPDQLQIVFVPWHFKYGMVRSHKNKFCRTAYFNHFHSRFGPSEWFLSLDIDEYIVMGKNHETLRGYLKGQSRLTGMIRFDSYTVPNVGDCNSDSIPTVRDFPYREKTARGSAKKYLLRQRAHKFSRSHRARLRFPYRTVEAPTSELAFFHYTRISTNWKERYLDRLMPETLDEAKHVEDRSVIEFLGADDQGKR